MAIPLPAASVLAESCGPGTYPCTGGNQSLTPLWWIVGAVGLVVLCFLIYGVTESTANNKVRAKGLEAIARVAAVDPAGGKTTPGYLMVNLELAVTRPDGTSFTAQHRAKISLLDPPKVGWEIPVRYLESRNAPPRFILTGDGGPARPIEDARPDAAA